jgi:hypothetical protein
VQLVVVVTLWSGCSTTTRIKDLGFASTMIDPDVYIRKSFRKDSMPYYEMILVYVDDVLCISDEPKGIMDTLGEMYELKDGSVCEPTLYLGANIQKIQLANGKKSWSMSSDQYVNASIATVNGLLHEEGRELISGKRQGKTPLPHGYGPEVDVTNELTVEKWSQYMQLIGILQWAVELGRIDIAYDLVIMLQYSASPREGHLEAVYHIFLYLSKHAKSRLVFDDATPMADKSIFMGDADWKDFYGDVVEKKREGCQNRWGKACRSLVLLMQIMQGML